MNSIHSTSSSGGTGQDLKDDVSKGARSLKENVEEKAEEASEKLKEYKESAKEMLHEVNNTSLADVENKVNKCIRESPTTSILSAAAVGFVIGVLFCRR